MKKVRTNNEGFSLVELIIVIAIMAILSAALAPQLIKYIDNSRKSTDVSTGQSIATAVSVALANEAAYNDAVDGISTDPGVDKFWVAACNSGADAADIFELAVGEIIGATSPTPKFRGNGTNPYNDFAIVIKKDGSNVSFEIYPADNTTFDLDDIDPDDMVYPTVGANYAD